MSRGAERADHLIEEFSKVSNWEERYEKIIMMGKDLPPMDESLKTESNKVKGCQSQVWLSTEFKDGNVIFYADSDASIAKGIIALLLSIYSELTPEEILQTPTEFLEKLGLRQHLSMSRANGLASMLKQITFYAIAFQKKAELGLI